jgi:hypothetical protein
MTRRAKVWRVIVAVFTAANVGGAVVAVLGGEPMHAAVHVALLVVTFLAWPFVSRASLAAQPNALPDEERLERLQASLDAIALDVERIGEAQRYAMKVVAERERTAESEPS